MSALSGFYKNSKAEIASIVKDIFNVDLAISCVSNSEARVVARCEEVYSTIELALSNSKILHIDETSHYNKGKLESLLTATVLIIILMKNIDRYAGRT